MANRYWVGGTGNWDTATTANWSATSGGANGASVPTAADDVFIDNKNAPNWAASTAYTLGSIRCPLAVANGYFYEVTTAGTSAATEPVWPTVVGNTVTDGTITWTCRLATVTKTTNATCLTLNFTNFIGTWTIANSITQSVTGTGAAITLGSGMTYTQGTTGVLSTRGTNTAVTINFNGITIPRLSTGVSGGSITHAVTINGVNPTVQHFRHDSSGTGTGNTQLLGTTLNIISSLFVNSGPGGVATSPLSGNSFNITGGGIVDVTTLGRVQSGFTVIAGTTVNMLSSLIIGGGTVTFQLGSFLIHNNNSFIFNGSFAGTILDSSVVTWYDFLANPIGSTGISISSNLNISRNLTFGALGPSYGIVGSGGTRNIDVGGNFSVLQSASINMTSTVVNLNGTGVLDAVIGGRILNTTFNINSSGYIIGSATRNYLGIENCTINLVGTNIASVFSNHSLNIINLSSVLNTNNTALPGGGQIVWENISFGNNTSVSLTNETTFTKNLTGCTAGSAGINGAKLLLGGNITTGLSGTTILGTSTIELYGSNIVNWNTAGFNSFYQNNIVINKSGGTVNLLGTINWGLAGRTLDRTNGNIVAGTSTVIIPNTPVTINNFTFWNLTVNTNVTIIQNVLNTIQSNLVLSGNATFQGTAGYTTNNFTHGGPGFVCTLQAGITYTVNGIFTMIGTALSRARLQSNDVASVTVSIAASPSLLMNVTAGTIPNPAAGYVLGSTAFSTALPPALSNIIPNRPTIASGSSSPYTLVNPIGATALTSYAGQVGKKAFFNVTNNGSSSTNVVYAETRDIDSDGGITIFAGQSFPDNTATPNLFRTLNWVPLIAPSGSVYYTFVS